MLSIPPLSRRPLTGLLAASGIFCFVAGVILSNFAHLAACPLCILQRMAYLLIGLVGITSLALSRGRFGFTLGALVTTLIAGTGAFIAGYQSWLQHHPEAPSCAATSPWWENFVYWAGEQAPYFFLSSGMCSDPGFVLFGLSIAEYSLLIFSGMVVIGLFVATRKA